MSKSTRFYIRITDDEKSRLKTQAKENGFSSISSYIKSQFLQENKQSTQTENFRQSRMNMRGVRLEEDIWQKLKKISEKPSDFIRQAILEKLQNKSH